MPLQNVRGLDRLVLWQASCRLVDQAVTARCIIQDCFFSGENFFLSYHFFAVTIFESEKMSDDK
jgi:hypothetical protein